MITRQRGSVYLFQINKYSTRCFEVDLHFTLLRIVRAGCGLKGVFIVMKIRCSAEYAKFTIFLLLPFSRSRFFSRFSCFFCLLTDIHIPLPKIHEIDSSRIFLPHVQNERSQNAREASINRYDEYKNTNNNK